MILSVLSEECWKVTEGKLKYLGQVCFRGDTDTREDLQTAREVLMVVFWQVKLRWKFVVEQYLLSDGHAVQQGAKVNIQLRLGCAGAT